MIDAPATSMHGHGRSIEFDLVCLCSRWPRSAQDIATIRHLSATVDWSRVEAVTRRQRVGGLVIHGLRAAGVALPPALAQRSATLLRANQRMAAETIRIDKAFTGAGIDALFVKGLTLAILAYGDTRVKMSLDIDMLVRLDDIVPACEVLTGLGYRRHVPDADVPDEGLREWVVHFKETAWLHPVFGTMVDLHGRLTSNPRLMPTIGLGSPRQAVEILPGHAVPTLATDPLFLYICVHGAETGWSRVKWIADLAALAIALGPVEVERLYRLAVAQGLGRCVAQGLLLAEGFLALDLGALGPELHRSHIARSLAWLAATSITGRYEIAPHQHDSVAGIPILVSHFLLRRDWRYRLGELGSKFSNPRDRARSRLPAGFGWLYPILSAGRLLRRGLPPAWYADGKARR